MLVNCSTSGSPFCVISKSVFPFYAISTSGGYFLCPGPQKRHITLEPVLIVAVEGCLLTSQSSLPQPAISAPEPTCPDVTVETEQALGASWGSETALRLWEVGTGWNW